jgi:hypothetical protein
LNPVFSLGLAVKGLPDTPDKAVLVAGAKVFED